MTKAIYDLLSKKNQLEERIKEYKKFNNLLKEPLRKIRIYAVDIKGNDCGVDFQPSDFTDVLLDTMFELKNDLVNDLEKVDNKVKLLNDILEGYNK